MPRTRTGAEQGNNSHKNKNCQNPVAKSCSNNWPALTFDQYYTGSFMFY